MIHATSTDFGQSWEREVIDPGYQRYTRPPLLVADPDDSTLHVMWFGGAERDNLELRRAGQERADIRIRTSTDGGQTRGEPQVVNDDEGDANQVHPGATLGPDGTLHVAWYDFRLSPNSSDSPLDDTGHSAVFHASSTDQGQTFSPNTRVDDRVSDRSIGVLTNNIGSAAPVGIVADESGRYFAWQDTRAGTADGQAEDVYFASLLERSAAPAVSTGPGPPVWAALGAAVALAVGGRCCSSRYGDTAITPRPPRLQSR